MDFRKTIRIEKRVRLLIKNLWIIETIEEWVREVKTTNEIFESNITMCEMQGKNRIKGKSNEDNECDL